jgi:hypothetical protein
MEIRTCSDQQRLELIEPWIRVKIFGTRLVRNAIGGILQSPYDVCASVDLNGSSLEGLMPEICTECAKLSNLYEVSVEAVNSALIDGERFLAVKPIRSYGDIKVEVRRSPDYIAAHVAWLEARRAEDEKEVEQLKAELRRQGRIV